MNVITNISANGSMLMMVTLSLSLQFVSILLTSNDVFPKLFFCPVMPLAAAIFHMEPCIRTPTLVAFYIFNPGYSVVCNSLPIMKCIKGTQTASWFHEYMHHNNVLGQNNYCHICFIHSCIYIDFLWLTPVHNTYIYEMEEYTYLND